jgi:hypothetical protein
VTPEEKQRVRDRTWVSHDIIFNHIFKKPEPRNDMMEIEEEMEEDDEEMMELDAQMQGVELEEESPGVELLVDMLENSRI